MKIRAYIVFAILCSLLLSTPASASAGLRVVIDKSEQRMYVYSGTKLLHNWPASTGKKSAYTPTGTFYVQRYWAGEHNSSKYGTKMIDTVYYDGTRAIHGVDDPEKLALLGISGTSMGCTVLSPENARTFYKLATSHQRRDVKIIIQQ